MSVHVAILLRPYIRLILSGRKTIESRLTRTSRAPYRAIEPGERIFFKASSGPYMATAVADAIEFHDKLTPGKVHDLRRRLNDRVCGDGRFWRFKRDSRYATFITLRDVEPTDAGPKMPPSQGLAWFVLDDGAGPAVFDVPLTAGAIRNGYVRVPPAVHRFAADAYGGRTQQQAGRPIELVLPGDDVQKTDLTDTAMLRWRGWGRYYRDHDVAAGDVVRFVQLGRRRYRVRFVRGNNR